MHRLRNSLVLVMALLLAACGLLEPGPRPALGPMPTSTRRAPALTRMPTAGPQLPALTPIPTAPPHALALTRGNAADVVELTRFGRGVAREFAWSADNQTLLLVAASWDGTVRIWGVKL